MSTDKVYLSHWRPEDPSVCCGHCGHGVFQRGAPDEPWACEACGKPPSIATQVQGKAARLLYVCAECDASGFRVSMDGLVCIGCGTHTHFDVLFKRRGS